MTDDPAAIEDPPEQDGDTEAPPASAADGDTEATDSTAEDGDGETPPTSTEDTDTETPPTSGGGRRWGFAVARAVVVLGVAAVVYQIVVPQTHVDRSRLSRLVTLTSGVKAFSGKPTSKGEQQASQLGVAALKTASQKSPHQTGVYNVTWQPSETKAGAIYALLLPDSHQAATTMHQVVSQQLSAKAFSSNGYKRESTFSVSGIAGSTGSLYTSPASSGSPAGQLALVTFQEGKTLGLTEVALSTGAQGDAVTMAKIQAAHLKAVQGGFTLSVVTRSLVATILWAVGAVVLAALIGFGPIAWRARAERRQRRIQEELQHQVRVGSQVIMKRRV